MKSARWFCLTLLIFPGVAGAADNQAPDGFTLLFNGKDFSGWHGLDTVDLRKLESMPAEERQKKHEADLASMKAHWKIENGELVNDGGGACMTTDKNYGDFELLVSWKLTPKADSGIYLKGMPQVQIWDTTEAAGYHKLGAAKGSGGLWNNPAGSPGKDPLVHADKAIGEWNTFRIIQLGARTTVYLNDKLAVDHAILQNLFDKSAPLYPQGPVQLQAHPPTEIRFKNVYLREIPAEEANKRLAAKGADGFDTVFDGKTLAGWTGATDNYEIVEGAVRCKPGKGGVLFTEAEYGDFVARVEFKLPEAGNNGLAIRYPGTGDGAYTGMCELQVLDTEHPKYAKLDPRQAHGSAYGMAPAARGYLRPTGQWNFQEVTVKGSTVKVELNGTVILDADLGPIKEFMANSPHPGKDRTSGHFGFAGHTDPVEFRNVQIKTIK
ncbi:MAG: DUF1080 domain-containing protein [Planctomycetaceae bacterium]